MLSPAGLHLVPSSGEALIVSALEYVIDHMAGYCIGQELASLSTRLIHHPWARIQPDRRHEVMPLSIQEVAPTQAPIALLLLADPSEEKLRSYLPASRCFVASCNGGVVGACVVQPLGSRAHELMCIAVDPAHQRSGYGHALLKHVIDLFRESGARTLQVGTGSFGYQLAFYQRHGFRVTGIDRDFFIDNYPEPLFEDGIQLFDMLRLTLVTTPK